MGTTANVANGDGVPLERRHDVAGSKKGLKGMTNEDPTKESRRWHLEKVFMPVALVAFGAVATGLVNRWSQASRGTPTAIAPVPVTSARPTPDDVDQEHHPGIIVKNLNLMSPPDAGPMILGDGVAVVESVITPGSAGLIQNGHVTTSIRSSTAKVPSFKTDMSRTSEGPSCKGMRMTEARTKIGT